MRRIAPLSFMVALVLCGCARPAAKEQKPEPSYFEVDKSTAATVAGLVRYAGPKPARKYIDMSQDLECERLHKTRVADEPIALGPNGSLGNVLIYIKAGLEGKQFRAPAEPVTIDQKGCWFAPRMLAVQTRQTLQVTNSDPVTHNIHPLAQVNREWNQSQGPGDPPLARRFARQEVLVPVKCNIHRWMRSSIAVVDHPYFAVTGADGSFELTNMPPGKYTIAAVHEALGTQEQEITLEASASAKLEFTLKQE